MSDEAPHQHLHRALVALRDLFAERGTPEEFEPFRTLLDHLEHLDG